MTKKAGLVRNLTLIAVLILVFLLTYLAFCAGYGDALFRYVSASPALMSFLGGF